MSALSFPDAPAVNDRHTIGAVTWAWDGTRWVFAGIAAPPPEPPPQPQPPAAPTNLRVTSALNNFATLDLAWDAVAGAIDYEVNISGTTRLVTGTALTGFGVSSGQRLTITVRARNLDGFGPQSNTVRWAIGQPQILGEREVQGERPWRSGIVTLTRIGRDQPAFVTYPANVRPTSIWFALQANFSTSLVSGTASRSLFGWVDDAQGLFFGSLPNPWVQELGWNGQPGRGHGFVLRGTGWSNPGGTYTLSGSMEAHGIETFTFMETYVVQPEVLNHAW